MAYEVEAAVGVNYFDYGHGSEQEEDYLACVAQMFYEVDVDYGVLKLLQAYAVGCVGCQRAGVEGP